MPRLSLVAYDPYPYITGRPKHNIDGIIPGLRSAACELCDKLPAPIPERSGFRTLRHDQAGHLSIDNLSIDTLPYLAFDNENGGELSLWLCMNRKHRELCSGKPEGIMLHADCLDLFEQAFFRAAGVSHSLHPIMLKVLWASLSSRFPWPDAPSLCLDNVDIAPLVPEMTAKALGFAGFATIPAEVRDIIRGQSPDSLLWTYSAITDLAHQLCHQVNHESGERYISVQSLASWEWGDDPLLGNPQPTDSNLVRLTMDTKGIRSVKRLPLGEPSDYRRFNSQAFATLDLSLMGNARLEFQVRHLAPQNQPPWFALANHILLF